MRHFHKLKNHYVRPVINLDKVWTLIGEEKREACAKDTSKAPCIDLTEFGIFKLLGKGQLPNQPIVIKCRYVSEISRDENQGGWRRRAVGCVKVSYKSPSKYKNVESIRLYSKRS